VEFGHVAACQAEAKQIVRHYYDLDNLVSSDPAVFDEVLAMLGNAARNTRRALRRRERQRAPSSTAHGGTT
jgi:anti-sigma factor ChrR (cupin superfamily)